MGLDVAYQAIPVDSGLIELARADVEDGWGLAMAPNWFARGAAVEGNRVWEACRRVAEGRPELRGRSCWLDRWWDVLHFLLSATRRGERGGEADAVIDRAFGTGEVIAAHVCGGQGEPVRWLSPEVVREIAGVVEGVGRDELARRYDPARMEVRGVYKFWADRAGEEHFGYAVEYFERFREFFVEVAKSGDGVIVCMD